MRSAQAADPTYSINCGGGASGSFSADGYASGGTKYTSTATSIDLSGVSDPAPMSVYESERYGMNFTYTFPHLTPGTWYFVRLHFAEYRYDADGWGGKPARLFNVSINGYQKLTNFNVYATAGADYKAVVQQFIAAADSNGKITIVFTGGTDNAEIKGIEVFGGIHLTNPSTTGNPSTGDGTNQYVYNAETPDGYLEIPGEITSTGATTNELQSLLIPDNTGVPGVDLKIENTPVPKTLVHTWKVSGSSILVKVPDRPDGRAFTDGRFVFQGLPDDNTGFGNHEVNLYIAGYKTETANIQTFFLGGNIGNFPGQDPQWGVPNWYHYYNNFYPSPTNIPCGNDIGYNSDDPDFGATYWTPPDPDNYNPSTFYPYGSWGCLTDTGVKAGGNAEIPLFDIVPNKFVRRIGRLSIKGVDTYILSCAHEIGHQTLFQDGIVYPYFVQHGDPPPAGFVDNDRDNVNDVWEQQHYLDNTKPDTTDSFSDTYAQGQDEELLAELLGFKEIVAQESQALWKKDWSSAGTQFGAKPTSASGIYQDTWHFHADVNGTTFVAGNDYSVHGISDLKAQYPNILTDLPPTK